MMWTTGCVALTVLGWLVGGVMGMILAFVVLVNREE